jgi:membrane protein DedA with SNARE-associated domain
MLPHLSQSDIFSLLFQYKYLILFPIIAIEGPITTVLAGFMASMGLMNFFVAYVVILAGDMAGDSLYFALGYWGREKLIKRWGKFLGITLERVGGLEKHFKSHTGKTIIIGKISHVFGVVVLLAAGLAKIKFREFFKFDFIATIPKSLILIFTGYYFGKAAIQSIKSFDAVALQALFVAILLIAVYLAIKKLAEKFLNNNKNA